VASSRKSGSVEKDGSPSNSLQSKNIRGEANAPPAAAQEAEAAPAPATASAPELDDAQKRKNAGASKLLAAAFGEVVTLLMRSHTYRNHTLADLEWLVVPAVSSGQFSLAEAQSKTSGLRAPVGLVLWASVSEAVDARLSSEIDKPLKLAPAEWKSGDIVWIVEALADPRMLEAMLKQLSAKQWAGREVKLRARGKDGKPAVGRLEARKAPEEPAAAK